MRIDFDKMEGAGNDFILVDNRDGKVAASAKRRLAVELCHRRFGIGADGMIFVENDPEFDFVWDFYNADGSHAEMCGNGARCVARFANKVGAAGDAMTFRTIAGPIHATLTPAGARVQLTDAVLPKSEEIVSVEDEPFRVYAIDTGVRHAVIRVEDVDGTDVVRLGRLLRRHEHFAPEGTNVDFISVGNGSRIRIRTYERGVEDETLACGTGSVAAALVAARFMGVTSPATVETRGGGELGVHFAITGDRAHDIFLEGGARRSFSGWFEA